VFSSYQLQWNFGHMAYHVHLVGRSIPSEELSAITRYWMVSLLIFLQTQILTFKRGCTPKYRRSVAYPRAGPGPIRRQAPIWSQMLATISGYQRLRAVLVLVPPQLMKCRKDSSPTQQYLICFCRMIWLSARGGAQPAGSQIGTVTVSHSFYRPYVSRTHILRSMECLGSSGKAPSRLGPCIRLSDLRS
jgi:hypothetical protein